MSRIYPYHPIVQGRLAALGEIYRAVLDDIAVMTMFDLYFEARAAYPQATHVGINVTDQDTSGGHWAGTVVGPDGIIDEDPDVFDEVGLLDLSDATAHVWSLFTEEIVGPDDSYLDLDAIEQLIIERLGESAVKRHSVLGDQ